MCINTNATAMTIVSQICTTDSFKLQLKSRRLNEQQCQVHFQATPSHSKKTTCGHMLVNAQLTLREVAAIIRERMAIMQGHTTQHHSAFYQIPQAGGGFIFFES
jgi:hypothetical protein